MENSVTLDIPAGYTVKDRSKEVKVWDAVQILFSRKQRYYTKAVRHGNMAELVSSCIVCPYCNKWVISNSKYYMEENGRHHIGERIPAQTIYVWSTVQMSLFDSEESTLDISSPPEIVPVFRCPECGRNSAYSEETHHMEIALDGRRISIRTEIKDIEDVMAMKWVDTEVSVCAFPIYETLVFNMEDGIVEAILESNDNSLILRRDITGFPDVLSGDIICNALTYNINVNRTVKRMFMKAWGRELPFGDREINVQNLFRMTMFVGYDREFYAGIPYRMGTFLPESSFEKYSVILRNSANVVKLYEDSSLPQSKSVRRIFFTNPSMFFYLPEAESLWRVIGDINHFCRMLKYNGISRFFSEMHIRPGIAIFLKDYCSEMGAKKLMESLRENYTDFMRAAADYSSLTPEMRRYVQEKWHERTSNPVYGLNNPPYSYLMHRPVDGIKDCVVNGFEFFWLRNYNDYILAAEKLENCLCTWNPTSDPVICAKRKDVYVAAIELADRTIIQVRGFRNSDITKNKLFNEAFEKWVSLNDLDFSEDYYSLDQDEE